MTLYALDCRGDARASILQTGPRVEGGIAVAPRTFGRFAGQLIAPDEHSGRIFAFDRRGRTRVVSQYRFPAGADIGVESVGFVPPGLRSPRRRLPRRPRGTRRADARDEQPADAPWAAARARGRASRGPARRNGGRCDHLRHPLPGSAALSARSGAARLPHTGRVISPSSRRRALRGRRLNGSGQRMLTNHEPSSTVPSDEKGRLKSLFASVKATPTNELSNLPNKQCLTERSATRAIFSERASSELGKYRHHTTRTDRTSSKYEQTMKTSAFETQIAKGASRLRAILVVITASLLFTTAGLAQMPTSPWKKAAPFPNRMKNSTASPATVKCT